MRARSGIAEAGATVSGPIEMTTKQTDAYGPQLPARSSAWTHAHITPGGAASAPSQVTASTDPSNVPSAADIGTPLPASPAVGAVVRRKSSAAAMVDPPRYRSSAVALTVERRAAPGGRGAIRTLPAHRSGPAVSPPGRAIVKRASVMSELERDGVPSSRARIRRKYRFPFGAVPRSHV